MSKKKRSLSDRGKKKSEAVFGIESPLLKILVSIVPLLLVTSMWYMSFVRRDNEIKSAAMGVGLFPHSTLAHLYLAEQAARGGDMELAREEYYLGVDSGYDSPILGLASEVEDMIWPERKVRRELLELHRLSAEVESREVYLAMADRYLFLDEMENASKYWEMAFRIDPNDDSVMEMEGRL